MFHPLTLPPVLLLFKPRANITQGFLCILLVKLALESRLHEFNEVLSLDTLLIVPATETLFEVITELINLVVTQVHRSIFFKSVAYLFD